MFLLYFLFCGCALLGQIHLPPLRRGCSTLSEMDVLNFLVDEVSSDESLLGKYMSCMNRRGPSPTRCQR